MTRRTVWTRLAEEDLTEAYVYIGLDSPTSAEQYLAAVENAVGVLLANPGVGRPREFGSRLDADIRSWPICEFPAYLIFYRATDRDLEIIRILHGARNLPPLLEDEEG